MGTDSVRSGFRLKPTAAVVVGAGPGLGRSCALTLARSGAEVFCVDIDRECATSVAEEIRGVGGAAFPFSGDMVVRADVDRMVSEAVTALGRIDACIDVVGWSFRDDIRTMDDETSDRNFALNLRHSFYITQIVGRQMTNSRTRGSIVHVSSELAGRPRGKQRVRRGQGRAEQPGPDGERRVRASRCPGGRRRAGHYGHSSPAHPCHGGAQEGAWQVGAAWRPRGAAGYC